MTTYAMQLLQGGHIVQSVVYTLTSAMGWWWVAMLFGAFDAMLYMKQRDVAVPAIVTFLGGSYLAIYMEAEARGMCSLMALLGFSALLFRIYRGRD